MSTNEIIPPDSSTSSPLPSSSSSDSIIDNFNMNQINETLNSLTLENPLIPQNKNIEPASFAELKANYIRNHFQAKKAEYCRVQEMTVSCVTWNVNGREPIESMSFVIPSDISNDPDIIVVGLQEIDRRAEAYLSNINLRDQMWTEAISRGISESGQYVKISSRALVGLYIVVFIKACHVEYVSNVSSASASCGIMGLVGNKGAVGLRFKLYNDYICVVNCHLAAHANQVMRRNQDLFVLHRRLIFYPSSKMRDDIERIEYLTDKYAMQTYFNVDDAEFVVWMGDFNYRVELPSIMVRELIAQNDIDSILKFDQMKLQKELGQDQLSRYQEAVITFAPSYSFNTGTDIYDTSEKLRVPSWCDRILWRDGDPVRPILYDCVFEVKSSDHKPVRQCSIFSVNEIVPEKYEACYLESIKQLDIFENAAIPVTEVSRHTIDVGELRYRQSRPESFSILNKGLVMAQYSFINPEGFTTPSWLKIHPIQGLIGPNETQEIDILFVYNNMVANLTRDKSRDNRMDHILIIHIEGGRDHFVAVSFQARDTTFGKSLSELKFHTVMLDRRHPKLLFKVPTILWRLIDFLINPAALSTDNLFLLSGPRVLTDKIQNALDLNEPFSDDINSTFGYHSIAETILRFFEALPDSLIPSKLFSKCVSASRIKTSVFQILNEIPEINFLVFEYFIRFIRDILLPENRTISKVAISAVLAPILVRKPDQMSRKELKDITDFFVLLL